MFCTRNSEKFQDDCVQTVNGERVSNNICRVTDVMCKHPLALDIIQAISSCLVLSEIRFLTFSKKMPIVKEWRASYYQNSKSKWLYGTLSVYPAFIRFVEQYSGDGGGNYADFRIYFDEFTELKKEKTTIFYMAITIRVKAEKYWFSSLQSCTAVFNIIEHFWRERLIDSSEDESGGKELLKMLHSSQGTLVTAAKALHRQGQQIGEACRTMNKLHGDLNVAETLIHSMDSWLSQWHVDCPNIFIKVPEKHQSLQKTEFCILYGSARDEKHLSGSLVLSEDGVELLNASRNILQYFGMKELSEITVHTPWEMTFAKYCIGKPDVTFHILSSRLIYILQLLEPLVGAKLSYEEPPENLRDNDDFDSKQQTQVNRSSETPKQGTSTANHSDNTQTLQQPQKVVSDKDADEMSQVLKNMKSMAIGIQQEQDRQSHQIEALSDSVDKANERIRKNARHVKHLT